MADNHDPIRKGIINGRAPGSWANSASCTYNSNLIADKVLMQNYTSIMTMGLPYALWREASSVLEDPLKCSCFKDTSKQPDIPCAQCYGTGYIPGYLKFGTQNFWVESTATGAGGFGTSGFGQNGFGSSGPWTFIDVVLDKTNLPNRLMMAPTATTAVAISPNLSINNGSKVGPWEAKADAFTRDGGTNSSILVEFSKDGGTTWFALDQMETQNPSSQLRFKVTFNRTAITVKTPMFEIVRARFATIVDIRGELAEPVIRAIPTWDVETEVRQNIGNKIENSNKRIWTLPLNFFDETLLDVISQRVQDDAFVEVRYGGNIGFRFSLNEFDYSDTFGRFTRMAFALRRVAGNPGKLPGEVYYRCF